MNTPKRLLVRTSTLWTLTLGVLLLVQGPAWLASAAATDPITHAEEALGQVERQAGDADVQDVLDKARQLLDSARAEGVTPELARAYAAGAAEWIGVASDWLTATAKEAEAAKAEGAVAEAQADLGHARALLEETEARRSRAEGILRQVNDPDGGDAARPPEAQEAPPAVPTSPDPAARGSQQ